MTTNSIITSGCYEAILGRLFNVRYVGKSRHLN